MRGKVGRTADLSGLSELLDFTVAEKQIEIRQSSYIKLPFQLIS